MSSLVEQLLANDIHFGHTKDAWNPRMKPYIAATIDKKHIIDLDKTEKALEKAVKYLKTMKEKGGKVLFVGTKPQAKYVLDTEFSDQDKIFFIDSKWSPGLLTNFKVIRERIDKYLDLKEQFATGLIKKYTKKEVTAFQKELDKLHKDFRGVANMRKLPMAIIVLDAVGNKLAIQEANTKKIPVIALTDTNADPTLATFSIPANDDSVKGLRFLVQQFVAAIS